MNQAEKAIVQRAALPDRILRAVLKTGSKAPSTVARVLDLSVEGAVKVLVAVITLMVRLVIETLKTRSTPYWVILSWAVYNRRWVLSKILARAAISKYSLYRSQLRHIPMPAEPNVSADNDHGPSAALRTRACSYIDLCVRHEGRARPFYLQKALCDDLRGRRGSLEYYFVKDLNSRPSDAVPGPDDHIVMIDVDYYLDELPSFLARQTTPVHMYTIIPETAAYHDVDSFRFLETGELQYHPAGATNYQHKLWNWSGDIVTAFTWSYGIQASAFHVRRTRIGPHRYVVSLIPFVHARGLLAMFVPLVKNAPLVRYNPVVKRADGGYHTTVVSHTANGIKYSVAMDGSFCSAEMSPETLSILWAAKLQAAKYQLSYSTVVRHVEAEGGTKAAASVLYQFFASGGVQAFGCVPSKCFVSPSLQKTEYPRMITPTTHEIPKRSVNAFMQPFTPNGFAPGKCLATEELSVTGRVLVPQATVAKVDAMDSATIRYVGELLDLTFPDKGTLVPVDVNVVEDNQPRPSQKKTHQDAREHTFECESDDPLNTFTKSEVAGKLDASRNITTFPGSISVEYSTYLYALADVFKTTDWYAFGRTPVENANRIVLILADADRCLMADAHRLDGHISAVARAAERMLITHCFTAEHAARLLKLHDQMYHRKARTPHGFKYETGFSRTSGSSETTAFNTWLIVIISYVTLRTIGHSKTDAYRRLGLYAGDDSIDADIPGPDYVRVAASFGIITKAEVAERGTSVNFISRFFGPDVWTGDPSSMCDLTRFIRKFPTCVGLPESPIQRFYEKLYSVVLSDRNTPLVRELKAAADGVADPGWHKFEWNKNEHSWWAQYDESVQWPNKYGDWMEEFVTLRMPDFNYEAFRQWCSSCRCAEDLLNPPLFEPVLEPSPSVPMDIDGSPVDPPPETECPFFKVGKCVFGEKCKMKHVPLKPVELPAAATVPAETIVPRPPKSERKRDAKGKKSRDAKGKEPMKPPAPAEGKAPAETPSDSPPVTTVVADDDGFLTVKRRPARGTPKPTSGSK